MDLSILVTAITAVKDGAKREQERRRINAEVIVPTVGKSHKVTPQQVDTVEFFSTASSDLSGTGRGVPKTKVTAFLGTVTDADKAQATQGKRSKAPASSSKKVSTKASQPKGKSEATKAFDAVIGQAGVKRAKWASGLVKHHGATVEQAVSLTTTKTEMDNFVHESWASLVSALGDVMA